MNYLYLLSIAIFSTINLHAFSKNEERIISFNSDITVRLDGSLGIRDTIIVFTQGQRIIHGIKRRIHTSYTREHSIFYEIKSITRNGYSEPYSIKNELLYIGDNNRFLSYGEHEYVIEWEVQRGYGFREDLNKMFWPIFTSTGWPFLIEYASVTLHFPDCIDVNDCKIVFYDEGRKQQKNPINDKHNTFYFEHAILPYEHVYMAIDFPLKKISDLQSASHFQDRTIWMRIWCAIKVMGHLVMIIAMMAYILFPYFRSRGDGDGGDGDGGDGGGGGDGGW
jgi:hypothetical protein